MPTMTSIFEEAVQNCYALIPETDYSFKQAGNSGVIKDYTISPAQYRKSVDNAFGNFVTFRNTFIKHLEGQKSLISAFASTPVSFSDAWNMKAESLEPSDVISLTKAGGHFQLNQIPYGHGSSGSGLYQSGYAKGLVKSFGTKITKGFRHKTGGVYEDDSLNEMGIFTYATPNNSAGMMEYRFAEQLSSGLKVPLIFIITQWFKYPIEFEINNEWIYMTGVAKVVGKGSHPHDPINLQLISKDEAVKHLTSLIDAFSSPQEVRIRPQLPEHLKLGWSYTKIKQNKEKRRILIEYARNNQLKCPGEICNHIPFSRLQDSNVHIGHRISQNWASQNIGVVDIHHPYNLYLSCNTCNSSLSDKYPSEIDLIINKNGTIGDWLNADLLDDEI
ncbi:MAG: hypothetical protein HWE14_05135 [Flavobacteriia bacterium]|nr:hypothetical protein [Flavobacteriia bacterium]